ncbi:MAG: lipopolysaccharide biosynthesis protein [Sedimentisphaerales bacterium]|nr:lipopolysaccharide biosynthesis protein [Sedimentisphaerales bacterium]
MKLISEAFMNITGKVKGDSLTARGARGGMVLGVGLAVERTLRFVRHMILTRILAPEAFGVMAIILTASIIFETLSDVGVRQSVIHHKEGDKLEYINIAWWFQGLRGTILCLIGILLAPWIACFYEMPELRSLLRMAFLGLIFNGLMSPRTFVLEKRLQFGRFVFLTQGSGILGTFITVGLAFYLRNIWALVIGLVSETVIRCVMSFVLCPFRPRLSIHRKSMNDLFRFGHAMFGLALLTVIVRQADIMVLGKVVSKDMLGLYYIALQLACQPVQLFERIVGGVLLPAFAEKQDNKESIRWVVLSISRVVSLFSMPLLVFVIIYARPLLSIIYGARYGEVSVPFSILCLWGIICVQAVVTSSVFIAVGLPHLQRRIVALRALVLLSLIYPAVVFWGLSGAALIVLSAYFVTVIVSFMLMRKVINLNIGEYIMNWLPGLWSSLIVIVPSVLLIWMGATGPIFNMVVGITLCFIAWSISLLLQYRSQFGRVHLN